MPYVKNLQQFLKEGLSEDQWFNYKEDTYLKLDNPGDDELRVANKVMELLETNDAANIIFTSNGDEYNQDYKFFKEKVLPAADKKLASGIKFDEYVVYYEHYVYQEKSLVVIFVKDVVDVSYIFIKEEDRDFFNELLGGDGPAEKQQADAEEEEIPSTTKTAEEL